MNLEGLKKFKKRFLSLFRGGGVVGANYHFFLCLEMILSNFRPYSIVPPHLRVPWSCHECLLQQTSHAVRPACDMVQLTSHTVQPTHHAMWSTLCVVWPMWPPLQLSLQSKQSVFGFSRGKIFFQNVLKNVLVSKKYRKYWVKTQSDKNHMF